MISKSQFTFKSKVSNPDFPSVADISPQDVHDFSDKVKLIDVRRPDEWDGELSHIPSAELITLDTLPNRIQELPKNEIIVFICRSGNRSAHAAAFALENGFKDVYNMAGGMLAWNKLKFPTAKN